MNLQLISTPSLGFYAVALNLGETAPLSQGGGGGGGGTKSIHDGGSDVFFWLENLHPRYLFGSSNLLRVFLSLKKYAYFLGSYLRANFSFRVFVAISGR